MTEIILEVKNLSVEFDGEKIIDRLSFKVKRGEFISIIGPNGSGKTTLLKALLGLIPYKGKIKWKKDMKINYLPQWFSKENFNSLPISVKEFFELKGIKEDKMYSLLSKVGVSYNRLKHKNPGKLSAGQLQRILLAWTFSDDPDVVLLDEPTTGIDVGGKKTIYDLLSLFWKGRKVTIFIVTHEINIVSSLSTNVICLHKKCLAFGKPEDVLQTPILEKTYGTKIKFHTHRVKK